MLHFLLIDAIGRSVRTLTQRVAAGGVLCAAIGRFGTVRALKRLRKALALRVRRPPAVDGVPEPVRACLDREGRLRVGQRDARYLPAASAVLDVFYALEGRVSDAAERLGLSTGNLSSFLTADDDLIAETNRIRDSFGLRPLRRD